MTAISIFSDESHTNPLKGEVYLSINKFYGNTPNLFVELSSLSTRLAIMRGTKRLGETINRGITAAAMTIAIAVIYATMATEGQVVSSNSFNEQIQAVFNLRPSGLPIDKTTQNIGQNPQESSVKLLLKVQNAGLKRQ